MSWSLAIRNGDLMLSGTSLGVATGTQKLTQDLACTFLEQMGNDSAHPDFGSLIDGGMLSDGTYAPSLIANSNWEIVSSMVEAEIIRICNDYRARQLDRARTDMMTYGHPTLTPDETLLRVERVDFALAGDILLTQIKLQTGSGLTTTINLPLSSSPVITS